MSSSDQTVVVADANVLINLIHVARLSFCRRLPELEFVLPEHVREEIVRPEQRAVLEEAVAQRDLDIVPITDPRALSLFSRLTERLGRGEAACLVLASANDWMIASDEKRRFRREAVNRLGHGRILGTADLFVRAIEADLLSVTEADADKATLEGLRFKLPFESFREMVGTEAHGRRVERI